MQIDPEKLESLLYSKNQRLLYPIKSRATPNSPLEDLYFYVKLLDYRKCGDSITCLIDIGEPPAFVGADMESCRGGVMHVDLCMLRGIPSEI